MSGGEDNAFAFLRGAASGDLASMRALSDMGARQLAVCGDLQAGIEALVFARMAATIGNDGDSGTLLILLALMNTELEGQDLWPAYREQLQGEAIAVASRLADAGNDLADKVLPAMVADADANVTDIAKDIAARMAAV